MDKKLLSKNFLFLMLGQALSMFVIVFHSDKYLK